MIKIQSQNDDWDESEWNAILAGAHLESIHRRQTLLSSLSSGQSIEAKYKMVTNDLCALCGGFSDLCGFDFMIGFNTVCEDCVRQYAPELLAKWPWETRIVKVEPKYNAMLEHCGDRPVFPWTEYAQMLLALENLKSTKQLVWSVS